MSNFRILSPILVLLFAATFCFSNTEAFAAKKKKYCYGGIFKPCLCASAVPKSVKYHPAEPACNGNAAILLRSPYLNVFSVVVRDNQNKDRWPVTGANGCTPELAQSKFPPNRCSLFKTQRKFTRLVDGGLRERVNCLGAPGTATSFSRVQRITAKLNDVPNATTDKIERWCIIRPECGMNLGSEVDCQKLGSSSSNSESSSSSSTDSSSSTSS